MYRLELLCNYYIDKFNITTLWLFSFLRSAVNQNYLSDISGYTIWGSYLPLPYGAAHQSVKR